MVLTRILLADDNEALLADLCNELEEEFEIVGTATNGQDAVDAVLRLDLDVILLDISMPLLNGIQASSLIGERHPRAKTLFLALHESGNISRPLFPLEPVAMSQNDEIANDLVCAIQEVSRGNVFVSSSLPKAAQ